MLYEETQKWPTNWSEQYGRKAPLCIEIGFGGGHFLIDLARKRPLSNILGIEISTPSIRRGAQKVRVASIDNIRIYQGSAWLVLWAMCELEAVDAVFINFPDPWPKSGHQHRRLISDRFLHLLATRMPAGATLNIATDHAQYATMVTETLERTPYFDSRLPTTYVTEDNERLRTKYELTAIAEGRTCHYYKWQRNSQPANNIFPIPKEHPMPHLVLSAPISIDDIRHQFKPQHKTKNDIHIKLSALFQSQDKATLLVETYIKEEPIAQRLGLAIKQRSEGEFVLSLHEIGFPRVTDGVHFAISALADWLVALHPNASIVRHNLRV